MLPLDKRHVLVCLRYGIGDVVMELPALARLRELLPRARLTALAAPPAHQLLQGGVVDAVVSTRSLGLLHRWHGSDDKTRQRIAGWIEASRFDLLLDVGFAPLGFRMAVDSLGLSWLESDLEEEAGAVAAGLGGTAAILRGVGSGWGMELPHDAGPILPLGEESRRFAARYLARAGVQGRPLAFSPVASSVLKRWPAPRFAELVEHALERWGGRALLFAGPRDGHGDGPADGQPREILARMASAAAVVVVPPLHLLRTAALLERCALLVCNDTGLMHIAAAVGLPVVAVFGPTSPAVYLPRAPRVLAAAAGGPCPYRTTGSLRPSGCWGADRCLVAERGCIEEVGVEEVASLVDALLAEPPAPPVAPRGSPRPPGRAARAARAARLRGRA